MRISDWSSDVCSSDLLAARRQLRRRGTVGLRLGFADGRVRGGSQAWRPLLHVLQRRQLRRRWHRARSRAMTTIAIMQPTYLPWIGYLDRKSVVSGKSVSVRVDLGGRRIIKKKKKKRK